MTIIEIELHVHNYHLYILDPEKAVEFLEKQREKVNKTNLSLKNT